jgi:hypothetical protein
MELIKHNITQPETEGKMYGKDGEEIWEGETAVTGRTSGISF